jgi:hypothetical protein
MAGATSTPIYQLKVTLLDTRPPVWRRLQVPATMRLSRLHRVLQVVMGWTESHLHQFLIDGQYYGEPDDEFGMPTVHERRVLLTQVVSTPRATFRYEYDFGDSWQHAVVVEQILDATPRQRYPVCLDGRRACPPEDVGGTEGYRAFLTAIKDPQHEEHTAMLEWVGGAFDPAAFDVVAVNRQLTQLR